MSDYTVPIDDINFLSNDALDVSQFNNLPKFSEADKKTINELIRQGARFSDDILAPLN